MQTIQKSPMPVSSVITIIFAVMIAAFLLLFGIANLIQPDVPDTYLEQNTRVCIIFIVTGLATIYSIFSPFWGGVMICVCSVVLYLVVSYNPIAYPIFLFGLLQIIRGWVKRRKTLKI
jgi:hypothetical protein